MKKFIINVVVYLALPCIMIFMIVELTLIYYPNSFAQKAHYFEKNMDEIEVIFLGSSHTEDGINPAYIDKKTANLGYSLQDYKIDLSLITNKVNSLPKLKYIIHEADYIELYKELDSNYFRNPWYDRYYNIKVGKYPRYKTWSLYLSNPDFFNQFLTNGIWTSKNINEYGYNDVEHHLRFYNAKYDSLTIMNMDFGYNDPYELNDNNLKTFDANSSRIDSINEICQNLNIKYILIIFPTHIKFRQHIDNSDAYKLWRNFINEQKERGVTVWDFYEDTRFLTHDFNNSTHLNNRGAKKLSLIISDSLNYGE